jgi:hypothetical protein
MIMPAQDKLTPDQQTRSLYHEVSLNLRPTSDIYITPYLSYSETTYGATGARTVNPSAMLSLTWSNIIENVTFNLFLMFQHSKSTDGWTNSDSTMILNSLVYDLGAIRGNRLLSFDLLYTRYADGVYHDNSYSEWLGRVMFTVAKIK